MGWTLEPLGPRRPRSPGARASRGAGHGTTDRRQDEIPFAQQIFDRGKLEGELQGKREALLRLLARAGIALAEDDRARIHACEDGATLDRWVDNVLGAKTAADVLC